MRARVTTTIVTTITTATRIVERRRPRPGGPAFDDLHANSTLLRVRRTYLRAKLLGSPAI